MPEITVKAGPSSVTRVLVLGPDEYAVDFAASEKEVTLNVADEQEVRVQHLDDARQVVHEELIKPAVELPPAVDEPSAPAETEDDEQEGDFDAEEEAGA